MKILILGIDGYIGWPLANHLLKRGHEVIGIDNSSRRNRAEDSVIPIDSVDKRDKVIRIRQINLDYIDIEQIPIADVIIHLGQMPSAPWSMRSSYNAITTQVGNIIGNLKVLWAMKYIMPEAHLIKLGSMGEYGTPECEIPEGLVPRHCIGSNVIHIDDGCPMKDLQFPRQPGSFYHLSKVFDTYNIDFACRIWDLKATDIMQGIVFGTQAHGVYSRFDYDEYFGTVINRFCAQAVAGIPLTIYGDGGQIRGFLPLEDSIDCLTIAVDNPPEKGEYRVFNQFAKTYPIMNLARIVFEVASEMGLDPSIQHLKNPRVEKEFHDYIVDTSNLTNLGYNPTWCMSDEIGRILRDLIPYKDRIKEEFILPKTNWR